MCAQFEILKVKVPTNFLGTVDFSLPRDGRYYKARGSAGKCDLACWYPFSLPCHTYQVHVDPILDPRVHDSVVI